MLEVGIVVCLALVFFLALRNFSKTGENQVDIEKADKRGIFSMLFSRLTNKKRSSVEDAIKEGQEKVVAPSETEEAQKQFKEKDPEIARKLFESEAALEKNDLRQAEELALESIAENKRCAKAYEIVGKIAFLRGSFDEAKESFKVALKCDSELAEGYYGLGKIDLRSENYTDAIENLHKAVLIERGNAEWFSDLGRGYLEVRQFAKAAKAFKRAASLDIDNKTYKELAAEAEEKQRAHATLYRSK